LILFLWGPEKLPSIARSLGKAKREFDKAMQEINQEVAQVSNIPKVLTPDQKLIDLAKSLGIETKGLTRDEIARQILSKLTPNTSGS